MISSSRAVSAWELIGSGLINVSPNPLPPISRAPVSAPRADLRPITSETALFTCSPQPTYTAPPLPPTPSWKSSMSTFCVSMTKLDLAPSPGSGMV